MNNIVIICCTSLKDYVEHVQQKLNTDYPVVYLSRIYHRDPAEMREHILRELNGIAETGQDEITVLVAMGFCGGSWDKVPAPVRLVIPRVDDCVSLLLQQTDEPISDLKQPGHLYVKDKDPGKECFRSIFEHMAKGLDEETKAGYHEHWKRLYSEIDIIDTGINGADRPDYVSAVKADADWLAADMRIVEGGTHLLEKLIAGKWDEQFMIVEPGSVVEDVLT